MPKRKAKKVTKQSVSSKQCNAKTNVLPEENTVLDPRVERQIAAIKTIREMETERLLTAIRLLKSSISKEQLETPLLQFFEENVPNLSVSRSEKNGPIEVKWKDNDCNASMAASDGGNPISHFLQHMSLGKMSFIGADNLQMKDFALEEPSETHILGNDDSMQTPGVSSGRLSVGMTPKTLRFPKKGEMLLSVHGSPLGVYKENNMDAIHETEEE